MFINKYKNRSSIKITGMKAVVTIAASFTAGMLPLWGSYLFWAWCMAQVPATIAMAGLIKVGITIGLIFICGSAVIGISALLGVFIAALCIALFDL